MWRLKDPRLRPRIWIGQQLRGVLLQHPQGQGRRPRACGHGRSCSECADNALFPQGGTWIYDRAGWCPGAPVDTRDMELTPACGRETAPSRWTTTWTMTPTAITVSRARSSPTAPPTTAWTPSSSRYWPPAAPNWLRAPTPSATALRVVLRNSGSTPLTFLHHHLWFARQPAVLHLDRGARLLGRGGRGTRRPGRCLVGRGRARRTSPSWPGCPLPMAGPMRSHWNNDEVRSTFRRPPTYTYLEDPGDEDDNRLIVFMSAPTVRLGRTAPS